MMSGYLETSIAPHNKQEKGHNLFETWVYLITRECSVLRPSKSAYNLSLDWMEKSLT